MMAGRSIGRRKVGYRKYQQRNRNKETNTGVTYDKRTRGREVLFFVLGKSVSSHNRNSGEGAISQIVYQRGSTKVLSRNSVNFVRQSRGERMQHQI